MHSTFVTTISNFTYLHSLIEFKTNLYYKLKPDKQQSLIKIESVDEALEKSDHQPKETKKARKKSKLVS